MNAMTRAALAGAAGAVTTNVLHELTRRVVPEAPRVDFLGMQGLAKSLRAAIGTSPKGDDLYVSTLAADLVSNGAYFSAVAAAPQDTEVWAGIAIGLAAGIGAVVLPPLLGLDGSTTARTTTTSVLTTALYTAGGVAAGLTASALA